MQWKRKRTRLQILTWFASVDEMLAPEGYVAERLPDLRKPLSSYDGRQLLSHVLFLINHMRKHLVGGGAVADIRESLGVVRTILSFCARVPSQELTPYL